jgi:hypothetical protein
MRIRSTEKKGNPDSRGKEEDVAILERKGKLKAVEEETWQLQRRGIFCQLQKERGSL